MPDDPVPVPAPTEAPTSAPAEPTYTHAEVLKILEAERGAAAPSDPVAKFRATVGAKQPEQRPAAPSRAESLMEQMLALQVANMQPARPPAPIKPMSTDEKLASTDPALWLGRDPNNSIGPADRAAIVQRHASKLASENFKGDINAEANARAARELSSAFRNAVGHVKVSVTAGDGLPDWVRRGR